MSLESITFSMYSAFLELARFFPYLTLAIFICLQIDLFGTLIALDRAILLLITLYLRILPRDLPRIFITIWVQCVFRKQIFWCRLLQFFALLNRWIYSWFTNQLCQRQSQQIYVRGTCTNCISSSQLCNIYLNPISSLSFPWQIPLW